jgi:hypothetical protein
MHKYADVAPCPACDSFNTHKITSGFGGYKESQNNFASERPRSAGFKTRKPKNESKSK